MALINDRNVQIGVKMPIHELALSARDKNEPRQKTVRSFDNDQAGKPHRVLIVDDNETNALVLTGLLEDRELDVTHVSSGEKAIEAFANEEFDLIFMDIHMPSVDGLEATRRIREVELESERPHTPILAVTAYDDPSVENSCEAVGMDGFLAKPVNPRTLDRFLDIWIE